MEKVGKEGVITVEEAKGLETTLDVVEGMQFDRGYVSPVLRHQPRADGGRARRPVHPHQREEDQLACRTSIPLLEQVARSGKPLLIIAEDVEGEALATLVVNKLRGMLKVCAVKAPGFGDRRKEMLQGHRHPHRRPASSPRSWASSSRTSPSRISAAPSGSRSTRTTPRSSTAPGKKADIEGRIKLIRAQIDETTSDYDREKLQERLAKLVGGVAVVKVGAATETEMKEKKARVEDALHATRAAVEEGIVPGGGVAYLRCLPALERSSSTASRRSASRSSGARSSEPLRKIASNAGVRGRGGRRQGPGGQGAFGFNARTEIYEDLEKAGVIDPTKVERTALQNAASVASLLLTTEAMIADEAQEEGQGRRRRRRRRRAGLRRRGHGLLRRPDPHPVAAERQSSRPGGGGR